MEWLVSNGNFSLTIYLNEKCVENCISNHKLVAEIQRNGMVQGSGISYQYPHVYKNVVHPHVVRLVNLDKLS